MKQKLLSILLNHFFISAVVALVVILCLPDYFSKYKLELNNNELLSNGSIVYYEDLDYDGKSEKIISQLNDVGNASFLLYKSNGDYVDQFNFSTKFPKAFGLWFQDLDENGLKEIYTVTQSRDSAFLNILEPFGNVNRKRIFIDTISAYKGEYEFRSKRHKSLYDIKIKNKDIVFAIMVGYAGNPRHIYKYEYFNDTIIKSPHLTNSSGFTHVMDIDNDGKNEILVTNNSPGNDIDSIYTKRSDYSTWLTILDDELRFLFEPKEFKALGSVQLLPVVESDITKLIAIFRSKKPNEMPSKLMQISTSGIIEKENILPNDIFHYLYKIDENTFALHARIIGDILIFNNDLEQIDEYSVLPYDNVNYYDIDADGQKEWISYQSNFNRISVHRKGFKNSVTIENPTENDEVSNFGIKYINETQAQLFFQNGGTNSIYNYSENPLYLYQYAIYTGIYGLVLGLVLLVIKGQKIQQEKKSAIEHEISTLQIKAVKNQVDPHFVFNAINTISEMTLMDNKLEADKFICRFSDFMRDTLQHSDKISTTLKEELDYTENFIQLQQLRFSHSFNYEMNVAKNVGLNSLVPKHVLFCYAENAIKHGLALKEKGELLIGVKRKKGKLLLYIEDNGGGIRKTETPKKNSTGNGLLIMERVFKLYTKLNKRKIEQQVIELFDDVKQKKGIRVEILISNAKK